YRLPGGPSGFMTGEAVIIENPSPVVTQGYLFQKTITIDPTVVMGTNDLMNFPLLVSILNDDDLKSISNGGDINNEDGYDIVFTDNTGNPIPFELIEYDPASGTYSAWVQLTSLSYDSETEILILYGKNSVVSDRSSPDLWSSEYIQVNHLDDPTEISDESGNGNFGSYSLPLLSDGKINNCRVFDGNDTILVKNHPTLDGTNDETTLSLWIKWVNAADGDHQLIMSTKNRYGSPTAGYEWAVQAGGNYFFYPNGGDNSNYNMASNPFTNGTWHYIAVTFIYSTRELNMFIDGNELLYIEENTPASWLTLADADNWLWGGNPDRPERYFEGSMDEIRVQTVARSAGWIGTEYINQNDPGSFYTISSELEVSGITDLCQNSDAILLNGTLPSGGTYSGSGVSGNNFDPSVAGAGTHTITYLYTDTKSCSSSGSTDQLVNDIPSPLIIGNNSVCFGSTSSYSTDLAVGNSYLWTINGSGASIVNGQGTNEIEVSWENSSGTITLSETIDNTGCEVTTSDFPVTAQQCQELVFPEGFSPNNDGINDTFTIPGLSSYPYTKLHIYNGNGNEVYFSDDYNNDWDGISNKGATKGKELPGGNYYYIIYLPNDMGIIKGFLYLQRE
ncbi:MAG: DUF2341 domain-containing protein, partial [Bacteroidales bacterium]|nr:DUF2341 domain-containing protein [Bacteroidales bacterium]